MTPVCRPLPTDGVTVIQKLQGYPILGITVKLDAICWKRLAVALIVSNYKDTEALFFIRFVPSITPGAYYLYFTLKQGSGLCDLIQAWKEHYIYQICIIRENYKEEERDVSRAMHAGRAAGRT